MATTRTIEIRTELPGPRSREILERKERVVAGPLSIYLPIVIDEAHGATVTDVDGNTFIDFTGGVGCLNVGHTHPAVVAAAQEQLERFSHTDFTIVPYEAYVTLADRLLERAPFRGPAKAAFFNA
ncbi:MAG: aminotransferase class III-fold pyridoxal phosphate-dependent enzyme, partial [Gaiellaceae bacterium]